MRQFDILYWCKRHRALLILAVIAVLWVAFELKACDPIRFWFRELLSDQDLLDRMNYEFRQSIDSLEEWYWFAAYNLLACASGCVFALQFLLPLLSGLLIAVRFSIREAEVQIADGQSKARVFLRYIAAFYGGVFLTHGVVMLTHVLHYGFIALPSKDWLTFLCAFLLRSVYICGWLSVTVALAFWTQHPLPTIPLSYACLFVGNLLAAVWENYVSEVWRLTPYAYIPELYSMTLTYDTDAPWVLPSVAVSIGYFVVFTWLAWAVFRKRDIART